MLRRVSILLVTTIALLPSGTRAGETTQQTVIPTFRSSTDVVAVTAVVRDRKGRFVRDLVRNDFVIAEDGRSKTIVDFRSESDGPVKLALLFDISGSMRVGTRADEARAAARHLLSTLRPADEAALYSFDTRLQRVHAFTSDVQALEAALDDVERPYGQTSLYDAVAEMSKSFAIDWRVGGSALPQRRAVVVLTDGVDTRSRLTPSEVSVIASAIDVPVYVVAVMSPIDAPGRGDEVADRQDGALRDLAQWTGGALFVATAPAHASVASRQIVDELRHQYVLAFEASSGAGWRPLEVRAKKRDLVVRARAGYSAGSNRS